MNSLKSRFWYSHNQRNGIFLLAIVIVILQILIVTNIFYSDEKVPLENAEIIAFQRQIDSLKVIEIESRKPKIFPFNPNFISDFKGEQLGMSLEEIDRLLAFRKTGKFVNSKNEFQKVTKISDSLLAKISPFFKFPEWVTHKYQNKKSQKIAKKFDTYTYKKTTKKDLTTTDLNKATANDLKYIHGIGEKLSERIIHYRSKLQGFTFNEQLYEVWGLKKEIVDNVLETFSITTLPIIQKKNVNILSFKELLRIPYVDYELCKKICNYRDEVAELQNISELKNIPEISNNLYNRLVLYLQAK